MPKLHSTEMLTLVILLMERVRASLSCTGEEYIHGIPVSQACLENTEFLSYAESILQRGSEFFEPSNAEAVPFFGPVLAPSGPRLVWEHVGSDKRLVDIGNSSGSVVVALPMEPTPFALRRKDMGFTSAMPPRLDSRVSAKTGLSPPGHGANKRFVGNGTDAVLVASQIDVVKIKPLGYISSMQPMPNRSTQSSSALAASGGVADNSSVQNTLDAMNATAHVAVATLSASITGRPQVDPASASYHSPHHERLITHVFFQSWMPSISAWSSTRIPIGFMQVWQNAWGLMGYTKRESDSSASGGVISTERARHRRVQGTLLIVCILIFLVVLAISVLVLVMSHPDKGYHTDNQSFLSPLNMGPSSMADSGYPIKEAVVSARCDAPRGALHSASSFPRQISHQESQLPHTPPILPPALINPSKDLCPELIVPPDSECLLTVRTLAGARASVMPGGRSASSHLSPDKNMHFNILDPNGQPVLCAEVVSQLASGLQTPPRGEVNPATHRTIASIHRLPPKNSHPAAGDLMAYCQTSFGGQPGINPRLKSSSSWLEARPVFKASLAIDIFDAQNDLYARLKYDENQSTWNLSGCRNLVFEGLFSENTMSVKNELGDTVADTQPSIMASDPTGKFYRLRASSGGDIGLLLCCLLAIDAMDSM